VTQAGIEPATAGLKDYWLLMYNQYKQHVSVCGALCSQCCSLFRIDIHVGINYLTVERFHLVLQ